MILDDFDGQDVPDPHRPDILVQVRACVLYLPERAQRFGRRKRRDDEGLERVLSPAGTDAHDDDRESEEHYACSPSQKSTSTKPGATTRARTSRLESRLVTVSVSPSCPDVFMIPEARISSPPRLNWIVTRSPFLTA